MIAEAHNWKSLLSRRLRDVACRLGYAHIEVCAVRQMKTRPAKMYAVVVADGYIYVITGRNENDMAAALVFEITQNKNAYTS